MPCPRWTGRHTLRRRLLQLACLAILALLPLFDLLRFDFREGRLHAFGRQIWLDEWAILWLFLMFAMWLVGAVALVLGRVYCAYACPQMVFSELAHDLDTLARSLTRRLAPQVKEIAARSLSLVLLAAMSVAASVLLLGYFAPLPEVARRLFLLDLAPWIGAVGAASALLAFLVFGFVREGFCRSACPYGLLQGVIEDGRSLHVRLDQNAGGCIGCGACARVCSMGIDIRQGSFQIECTRCGSCIDACAAVLGRLKPPRPSILGFDFGGASLGRWDAKRALVGLVTTGFGIAFLLVLAGRQPVSLQLSPLYESAQAWQGSDLAESRALLRAANRGQAAVRLTARTEGLPASAALEGIEDGLIPACRERTFTLVVRVPRSEIPTGVIPFAWVISAADRSQRFGSAFFTLARSVS
jgi:polyferredoxin